MEGSLSREDFEHIYQLTGRVNPRPEDCGKRCSQACCRTDASQGIYLLPGEHQLYTGLEDWFTWDVQDAADYLFPRSWEGEIYFLHCAGHCSRDLRPMQCRTYPVAPHLTEDGRFVLVRETLDTTYRCPLITENMPLLRPWLKATWMAWTRLLTDPLIHDLVRMDSAERRRLHRNVKTAYGHISRP